MTQNLINPMTKNLILFPMNLKLKEILKIKLLPLLFQKLQLFPNLN